jgi:hypothetical protein
MIRKIAAVLLAVVAMTGMASAHGGPIALDVRGDGGQGVTVTVSDARDHHPVETQVDLSFTAVNAQGRTVGPVALVASNEGRGFYVSEEPLPVGRWTVTVTATRPSPATKTVSISAVVLPPVSNPAPAPGGLPAMAVVLGSAAIAAVLAVVGFFGAALIRRRRAA